MQADAFFAPGERIGVAVSGGADSVALLLLLLALREQLGIVLSVVHLNHKLRSSASDADEKFVAALAAKFSLPFYAERLDVNAEAKREKTNLEDAARRARQDFFAKLVSDGKIDRVAVAHTADDQAETVLAHILRGSGLAGLGAIHPRTETVVRPLLKIRRADLRSYLRSKKQKWREDATNRDTTRLRARIRTRLLPLLERQFHREVVNHLVSLSEFAREDEQFLDRLASERCAALAHKKPHATRIAIGQLLDPFQKSVAPVPPTLRESQIPQGSAGALTKRILRRLIEQRKKGNGQITAQHIAAVLALAQHGQSGKALQLPGGVEIRRERRDLVFCRRMKNGNSPRNDRRTTGRERKSSPPGEEQVTNFYEHEIDLASLPVSFRLPQARCVFRLRVIDWPRKREETKSSGAVLDRDQLRLPLLLRNWRPGDRLQPAGHQKAHKLKRLLNKKRVSRWERDGWPVLASGGTLVWARGFPAAAGFTASEGTKTAILIAEETLDA